MKNALHKAIRQVDIFLAPLLLTARPERNAINAFLFHALFKDEDEIKKQVADPQQQVTVDVFRRFIAYHLKQGYSFVTPQEVLEGTLKPDRKYILLTFDDGYYNNVRALPVLEEFGVPALFFITANNVLHNKAFWWDVAYREGKKAGMTEAAILSEKEYLLTLTDPVIDSYLHRKYGINCFKPVSDTDRPFTPEELKTFAQHPLVHIGNHTCDHAVLPNYTQAGVRSQIARAQHILESITGYRPLSIAYPCGEFTEHALKVCEEEGIMLGITTNHAKNFAPDLAGDHKMLTLNRFTIWGNEHLESQCAFYRSDYHLLDSMRNIYQRIKQGLTV